MTVAAFSQPVEAHLARGRLECEGIECFIADEHIVGIDWLYSAAVGGVKLKVRREERERAVALLETARRPHTRSHDFLTADLDAPRCPGCGSLRIDRARVSRPLAVVSWLLIGIPLPFLRRRSRCLSCGLRWRAARCRRDRPEDGAGTEATRDGDGGRDVGDR